MESISNTSPDIEIVSERIISSTILERSCRTGAADSMEASSMSTSVGEKKKSTNGRHQVIMLTPHLVQAYGYPYVFRITVRKNPNKFFCVCKDCLLTQTRALYKRKRYGESEHISVGTMILLPEKGILIGNPDSPRGTPHVCQDLSLMPKHSYMSKSRPSTVRTVPNHSSPTLVTALETMLNNAASPSLVQNLRKSMPSQVPQIISGISYKPPETGSINNVRQPLGHPPLPSSHAGTPSTGLSALRNFVNEKLHQTPSLVDLPTIPPLRLLVPNVNPNPALNANPVASNQNVSKAIESLANICVSRRSSAENSRPGSESTLVGSSLSVTPESSLSAQGYPLILIPSTASADANVNQLSQSSFSLNPELVQSYGNYLSLLSNMASSNPLPSTGLVNLNPQMLNSQSLTSLKGNPMSMSAHLIPNFSPFIPVLPSTPQCSFRNNELAQNIHIPTNQDSIQAIPQAINVPVNSSISIQTPKPLPLSQLYSETQETMQNQPSFSLNPDLFNKNFMEQAKEQISELMMNYFNDSQHGQPTKPNVQTKPPQQATLDARIVTPELLSSLGIDMAQLALVTNDGIIQRGVVDLNQFPSIKTVSTVPNATALP